MTDKSKKSLRDKSPLTKSRREFLLAARTPSLDTGSYDLPVDEVPIPPADAEVLPPSL